MFTEVLEKVEKLLLAQLKVDGLELFDLSIKRKNSSTLVEVLIDRPEGGINIEQCSSINRLLADEIEVRQWLDDPYSIEVSSPGLDRPLVVEKDFKRVIGKPIRVHLKEKLSGKLEHHGKLTAVASDAIVMLSKNSEIRIFYDKIQKAVQEI